MPIIKVFNIYLSCDEKSLSQRAMGFVARLRYTESNFPHMFCSRADLANVCISIQVNSHSQLSITIQNADKTSFFLVMVNLYLGRLTTFGLIDAHKKHLAKEKDLARKIIFLSAVLANTKTLR